MKKSLTFLLFLFLTNINLSALTVTPDASVIYCGTTTVTFTFDCPFTGFVLLAGAGPPSGITFSNEPITSPPFYDVVNGEITFDIDIATNTASSFPITFLVVSSDQACAVAGSDNATATVNYNCILPANDDCPIAFPIGVESNTCTHLNFSTINTTSTGLNPSCDPSAYVDLWYSFYANNTTVVFEYNEFPGVIVFLGLYSDCPNNGGVELDCQQVLNTTNTPGSVNLTGLTVNTKYYLQLNFNRASGTNQSFCLQSNTPTAPCMYNVVVSDIGPNLPASSYQTSAVIETSGNTTVTTPGVIYDAGVCVDLNPGFECIADFEIIIAGCTP